MGPKAPARLRGKSLGSKDVAPSPKRGRGKLVAGRKYRVGGVCVVNQSKQITFFLAAEPEKRETVLSCKSEQSVYALEVLQAVVRVVYQVDFLKVDSITACDLKYPA